MSDWGDQPYSCSNTAPSPLSSVNQANHRLRKSDFCYSAQLSSKTEFSKEKTHFTFEVKSSSLSGGSLGGSGTLDVLYEDPEEDLLSTLSEDDQRRLITDDDSSDEVFLSPNPETLEQTHTAWTLLEEEISDIFLLCGKMSDFSI